MGVFAMNKRFGRLQESKSHVIPVRGLRDQLVRPGDLRNEIGFQNDINILMGALDDGDLVWNSEAPLLSPDFQMEDGMPTTISELECIVETTTSELWAVPDPTASHRAA